MADPEIQVAALFVQTNGVYFGLPDVDPWDEQRDARKYAGPWPVVAHPPCERWSQMNRVNAARWGYALGEDGGCFESALSSVRRFGGVLEHPAESMAFAAFGIPRPNGVWTLTLEGDWITQVRQSSYGHRATKRTWLLYHGNDSPPAIDWRPTRGTHQIGGFDVTLPQLPRGERAKTPLAFRDTLLAIARTARAPAPLSSRNERGPAPSPRAGPLSAVAAARDQKGMSSDSASVEGVAPAGGCFSFV